MGPSPPVLPNWFSTPRKTGTRQPLAYDKLKDIHSRAYSWDAPDIYRGITQMRRPRIRPLVRRWINEWDLRRLYPELEPDIEATEVQFRYEEDTTLEHPASDDPGSATIIEADGSAYGPESRPVHRQV